jgi:rubrerythrin
MNLQEREARMFTAKELLDIAVRLERNGDAIYRQAIEKVSNPELASLLEWMADEEVKHAEYSAASFSTKCWEIRVFLSKMWISPKSIRSMI